MMFYFNSYFINIKHTKFKIKVREKKDKIKLSIMKI